MDYKGKFSLTLNVIEIPHPSLDFRCELQMRESENGPLVFSRDELCNHASLRRTIDNQLKSARERIITMVAEGMDP